MPASGRLIRHECERLSLPIVSVACVAVGLIDFNRSVQRFHMKPLQGLPRPVPTSSRRKTCCWCLGEYIWNQEVIPPDEQWKTGVERLRELGEYAANLGLQIALELEPFPYHCSTASVRWSDSSPKRPPGGAGQYRYFAFALAKVPAVELRRLKGKAIHVHISDCDGIKHGDLPPGRGVVDFGPYLREIKALGIDGAVSIEPSIPRSRAKSPIGSARPTPRPTG